jgi:NitT/TauT family transport system substrate-binding protein
VLRLFVRGKKSSLARVLGAILTSLWKGVPMTIQHARLISRRRFLGGLTRAGTAGLLGLQPRLVGAEPPPETTTITLVQMSSICQAPQYIAEELLRAEGFTEVHYVKKPGAKGIEAALASGEANINMHFSAPTLIRLEAGDPVVILAGVHIGCFELVGTDQVRSIRDLQGKTVAIPGLGETPHIFLASMAAYVGLDPRKDINWVTNPPGEMPQLLADGKIDAFMTGPPAAQELRAKGIGHVVVNSTVDRPWSQYFCCIVIGNREFVRKHPVATKRALRAILKSADMCAVEPERSARFMVDKEYAKRYDYALQAIQELPYGKWREYDPEDTVRFYALRLHEIGMVKSSPQKLIAQGTDWRFLNELKKELKQ